MSDLQEPIEYTLHVWFVLAAVPSRLRDAAGVHQGDREGKAAAR